MPPQAVATTDWQAPMIRWPEGRAANLAWTAVVVLLVIVGYLTAGDFGISWDEPDNAIFGRQALEAYASLHAPAEWHSNLESKGPFFVALTEALIGPITAIRGGEAEVEARHFAYFLILPVAATALYSLGLRIARPWAAFAAALLFLTPPLVFGPAFINPKDTPFMAFFLASMALGVSMSEPRGASGNDPPSRGQRTAIPLAAGAGLGLTTSIRVFGPFAGLLVSLLAVLRLKRRALVPLGLYWVAAGLTTYLAWPYLWGNPWGRMWDSLGVMLSFPWDNLVLYRGLVYAAEDLPWHYLPFTTVIQLTEPALLLAFVGGVVGLVGMVREPRRRLLYAIFFLWTAVPSSGVPPPRS